MNKKFSKRSVKNVQERSANEKKLEGFTDLGLETYDNQAIMNSREFADRFEKRHDHIIRDIEREISYMNDDDGEFNHPKNGLVEFDNVDVSDYFIVSYYKDKKGEKRKQYLLTKDGFSLVANGMTGRQAAQWRRQYIQTFNAMEKYIREGTHLTEERDRILGQVNNLHTNPKAILKQKEIERQFKLRDPKMDV